MNILDCVIRMEEEVKNCYEKMSASAAFPELKNLFTMSMQEAVCHFNPLLAKRDLFAELMGESHAYPAGRKAR